MIFLRLNFFLSLFENNRFYLGIFPYPGQSALFLGNILNLKKEAFFPW
jgi:hypothetical protein